MEKSKLSNAGNHRKDLEYVARTLTLFANLPVQILRDLIAIVNAVEPTRQTNQKLFATAKLLNDYRAVLLVQHLTLMRMSQWTPRRIAGSCPTPTCRCNRYDEVIRQTQILERLEHYHQTLQTLTCQLMQNKGETDHE